MNVDVSRDYLDRAYALLREAEGSHGRSDWPLCVLRSAECLEFSLKAILGVVGIEYEHRHDVSGDILGAYEKFPKWFRAKVPRISMVSRVLSIVSIPAKYGDELLKVSPKSIFERPEAQAYLDIAKQVYWDCNRLFFEINRSIQSK